MTEDRHLITKAEAFEICREEGRAEIHAQCRPLVEAAERMLGHCDCHGKCADYHLLRQALSALKPKETK